MLAQLLVPLALLAWPMISLAVTALAWVVSVMAVFRHGSLGCAVFLGLVWLPVVGLSFFVYGWMVEFWPGIANDSEMVLWSVYGAVGAVVFSFLAKMILRSRDGSNPKGA